MATTLKAGDAAPVFALEDQDAQRYEPGDEQGSEVTSPGEFESSHLRADERRCRPGAGPHTQRRQGWIESTLPSQVTTRYV